MRFGVHSHYNNNSVAIGRWNHPTMSFLITELPVRITDQGLMIFSLDKKLNVNDKLRVASELDKALKAQFGRGISFATSGYSDCLRQSELTPFYEGMKGIDPDIITIYATGKNNNAWLACPADLKADHVINMRDNPVRAIVSILKPSEADRAEPEEGWSEFEDTVRGIFQNAQYLALTPHLQNEPVRGVPVFQG